MKAPSFPTGAAAFHALSLAFFGGCAYWLAREAPRLGGRQGAVGWAVATAAAGLAVLSLVALGALVHARKAVPLRSRAPADTYFQVLTGAGVLAVVGLRLVAVGERPALATFCLGLGAWLLLMGFHLVPALLLVGGGFVDHLGKRTRFTDLEWFTLKPLDTADAQRPRALLTAGQGPRVRIRTRLVGADAEGVRKALTGAGVSSRPPGR